MTDSTSQSRVKTLTIIITLILAIILQAVVTLPTDSYLWYLIQNTINKMLF